MAAVVAEPAAVFGCRPRVGGGVCFVGEREVLHAAGAGCARLHTEHGRQAFLPGGPGPGPRPRPRSRCAPPPR